MLVEKNIEHFTAFCIQKWFLTMKTCFFLGKKHLTIVLVQTPFSCCSVLLVNLLLWACRQFVLSACLFQQVDPTNNE